MSAERRIRFGLIGCGKTGARRAAQLGPEAVLVAVHDRDPEAARALAQATGAAVAPSAEAVLRSSSVDAVVVSTFHDTLAALGREALLAGKHVLLEKPGARRSAELRGLAELARERGLALGVGFNHRFHPGLARACELVRSESLGPLLYFRARYGHGARPGYEREWRADPAVSGGGELLDQGVHLIDLCRWMGGELRLEYGAVFSMFWPMPVEDNGVLVLRSPDGRRAAFLHASCTEWKNLFDFEIFCRQGKIQVTGLGRSYGTEELRVYRMPPETGPPALETFRFGEEDGSWSLENQAFIERIRGGESPALARVEDAIAALETVEAAYRQAAQRSPSEIPASPWM